MGVKGDKLTKGSVSRAADRKTGCYWRDYQQKNVWWTRIIS